MADPFVGEIRIFCGNFAPTGWAFCNGQFLPIAQNTALFSLLGTTYGGDGKSNFALPNLQGRFPMHPGGGPGLSNRALGEASGQETVTILASQMPSHTHQPQASAAAANLFSPVAAGQAMLAPTLQAVYGAFTDPAPLDASAIAPAGGSQPHENRQPYLALNFIIALQGTFPPRA
jgi:microcystin-dependent protein